MNTLSATTSLLTYSMAWAILNSLWQGLAVYGVLYILLKCFPDVNARIKHYTSFAALSTMALWFADTWLSQYQKLRGTTVYITNEGTDPSVTTTHTVTTTG